MATLLIRLLAAQFFASTSWSFPSTARKPYVSPPEFVQEAETSDWTVSTPSKTTSSFNVKAGDILVALGGSEYGPAGSMTVSGGSLTWSLKQEYANDMNNTSVAIWTAVVDSDKSMSVTFTATAGPYYGGNVLTFRRSGGVGNSNKAQVASGGPSVNVTTTKANSAIVVFTADWNALDGSSRTWRTNAGAFTEQTYFYSSSRYTIYGGFHLIAGPAGTYAVGLSAPNTQKYSIVAVEIKGQ